jgi:molybdopterin-biosynthesis enzyme MoeA-like protein
MLDAIAPTLATGEHVLVEAIEADSVPEGRYAKQLAALAEAYPQVSMGSYPHFSSQGVRNQIVLRSREAAPLAAAKEAVLGMVAQLRSDSAPG